MWPIGLPNKAHATATAFGVEQDLRGLNEQGAIFVGEYGSQVLLKVS